MLKFTELQGGNLLLQACNETRANIANWQTMGRTERIIMFDLFESESCNGGYCFFMPDDGDFFVGLTEAPCIAESLDYLDDGHAKIVGKVWWYPDYMIKSQLEELKSKGRTVFQFGFNADENERLQEGLDNDDELRVMEVQA